MKILLVDITGKVPIYNAYLARALVNEKHYVVLASKRVEGIKSFGQFHFWIPNKYVKSKNAIKRTFKVFEAIVNYFILVFKLFFSNYDVIHFQWLPFLEICSFERYVLKLIRLGSPHAKVILTIHNIYPHEMNNTVAYRNRILKIKKYFDLFIVHTQKTSNKVLTEFDIDKNNIAVIHHGIFEPERMDFISKNKSIQNNDVFKILHFGLISPYKGTDILINAIQKLPEYIKSKIELNIVGHISVDYYGFLKKIAIGINVNWLPHYVDDDLLNTLIYKSDLVVFPYRKISQSGALLLSLFFEKPILTSDLDEFIETLYNFNANWFFNTEDIDSLSSKIKSHINGDINRNDIVLKIKELKKQYSWSLIAKKTIYFYS